MVSTKQDFDRAIKGSVDRIKKIDKQHLAAQKEITRLGRKGASNASLEPKLQARDRLDIASKDNELELKKFVGLRRKAPSGFKDLKTSGSNKHNVRELQLFIENDGQLHRQQGEPILKNLTKKIANGVFDVKGAAKLYKHFADTGAKKYGKDFGSGDGFKIFSVADRNQVAKNLAGDFASENSFAINKQNSRKNLLGR